MKRVYTLFTLVFLLSQCRVALGQHKFVEGQIVYLISIEHANPDAAKKSTKGKFTISLKGNNIVKQLELGTGFKNKLLINANDKSVYSLREMNGEQLALQLDPEEFKKRQSKCKQLLVEALPSDNSKIAQFKTEKAQLRCANEPSIILWYTKDWVFENANLFDDFPGFTFLPLAYEIKKEDGTVLHFELEKIESKPLDNAFFKIPSGYKIISNEELKSWHH